MLAAPGDHDLRCHLLQLVIAADNPHMYVEARGTVSLSHDGARELIDTLAAKYMGTD